MADKTLLENGKVQVVTTTELDRYEGRMYYSQAECELVTDDFKEQNKVWTTKNSREGFECLDTKEDWEPEGESLQADMESFQKYLDETYGKDKYAQPVRHLHRPAQGAEAQLLYDSPAGAELQAHELVPPGVEDLPQRPLVQVGVRNHRKPYRSIYHAHKPYVA